MRDLLRQNTVCIAYEVHAWSHLLGVSSEIRAPKTNPKGKGGKKRLAMLNNHFRSIIILLLCCSRFVVIIFLVHSLLFRRWSEGLFQFESLPRNLLVDVGGAQ